jgi:hypothetical protein
MTDFLQTLDERSDGIGAADETLIDSWFTGQRWNGEAAEQQRYETTAPVGWLYTEARWNARWDRMRAFDRIPAYVALEPAGNHTFGATEAELRLGCPAWPR